MADIKVHLFAFAVDDPPQVIDESITFTISSKTSRGGVKRIGRGFFRPAILRSSPTPPLRQALANYGFSA